MQSNQQHLKHCAALHNIRPHELAPVSMSQQSTHSSQDSINERTCTSSSKNHHTSSSSDPAQNSHPSTRSINDALLAGPPPQEPRTVFSALMQAAQGIKRPRSSVIGGTGTNGVSHRRGGRGGWGSRSRGRNGHWSRPAKRPFTSCPAFKIVAGTDLVVDGFLYAHPQLSMRYFLTHFHSDHYTGLDKHFSAGTVSPFKVFDVEHGGP
jgi:hypothetical protein